MRQEEGRTSKRRSSWAEGGETGDAVTKILKEDIEEGEGDAFSKNHLAEGGSGMYAIEAA